MISGSGTASIVITLAKPISNPDRVTLTISNSAIVTYTRRLDVLPGDVNDDGAVNTTDGVLMLRNETPANAYNRIYDMNGDGAVNTTDFNLYRPRIGNVLPGLSPQLAAGGEGPGTSTLLSTSQLAPVLGEAVHLWSAAGLPAADLARLKGVTLQVETLPPGYLGETPIGGTTITLSADAAGHGWFVDIAPTAVVSRPSSAIATRIPAGQEDLLTVVMHELGHTLGLGDLNSVRFSNDLMAENLSAGVRRLPSARDVANVIGIQPAATRILVHSLLVDEAMSAHGQEAPIDTRRPGAPGGLTVLQHATDSPMNIQTSALRFLSRRRPGNQAFQSRKKARDA